MKAPKKLIICAAAVITAGLTAVTAEAADTQFDLRIVHTTDIHARIEENEKSGIIGLAKVKTAADEFKAGSDISFTIDSGDLFHGQPLATLTDGGAAAELIKLCGYDCMTPGNHDWSYGKDRLKELAGEAGIKCLAGNILDENGDRFFDDEFYITTAEKDGKQLKIGFFGVSDPALKKMVIPSATEGLDFTEPLAYANKAAEALRAKGCDVVIALAHVYSPDELAAQTSGVDIWLCGHEHMVLDDKVTDKDGKEVRIIESGYYLYSMSTADVKITAADDGTYTVDSIETASLTYDDVKDKESDEQVSQALADIKNGLAEKLTQKVGSTPEDLDGVWEHLRTQQTNLGKAVAGSYLLMSGADAAFENAGGIRASVAKGDVTYNDIIGVSPYGNLVVTKQISGSDLKKVVERNISFMLECRVADESGEYDVWPQYSGSVLQMAGIYAEFDPEGEDGDRISYIEVGGKELDENKLYTVATNSYVAESIYYTELAQAEEISELGTCEQALIAYFSQDPETVANDIRQTVLKEVTPLPDDSSEPEEESKPEEDPSSNEDDSAYTEESEPDVSSKDSTSSSSDSSTKQIAGVTTQNPVTGVEALALSVLSVGAAMLVISKKRR